MEHNYIPLFCEELYFVLDTTNRYLYPCTQRIYNYFVSYDKKQLKDKSECDEELSAFLSMLIDVENNVKYAPIKYDEVTRKDVLLSLARVPHITLEITRKCNLACVYCCNGKLYKQSQPVVDETKIDVVVYLRSLLKLRKQYGVKTNLRISFYGGEPLLKMDTIKACVTLVSSMDLGCEVSFGMTTNGMLLNKYADYLVEHDFRVMVSLDGDKRDNGYRVSREGKESFERVLSNIEKLRIKYPSFFESNVEFSTVLHGRNNFISAVDFFSKWNKIPILSQIVDNGRKKHVGAQCDVWNLHAYTSEEIEDFRKRYPNASKVLLASNNMVNDLWKKNFHDPLCVIDRLLYKNTDLRLGNCFLFSTRVFISTSGELYLCEKSSRNFKFGKVHKDVLYIYLKRINGYYKDIGNILNSHCLSCYKNDRCECCYFAEKETITQNKCFYSREQAINDFHNTIK